MVRVLSLGLAVVLFGPAVSAQEKNDKDKPAVTTWTRETNGIDIKFEIGKDTLKAVVFSGENGFIATCKTTTDKDGVVKVTVTDVEKKGNFPTVPHKDYEFSFKWKVTGDKAELSDLKGDGIDDAKPIVEGEYKKKK